MTTKYMFRNYFIKGFYRVSMIMTRTIGLVIILMTVQTAALYSAYKVNNSVFTPTKTPITASNGQIGVRELFIQGDNPDPYTSDAQYSIDWDGSSSQSTSMLNTQTTDPTVQQVTRTINPVWTWTFTGGNFSGTVPAYDTSYSVTNFTDGISTVPVTITKTAIRPVKNGSRWTLQESVTLTFNFSNAKTFGKYTGSINMTVTPTNFSY